MDTSERHTTDKPNRTLTLCDVAPTLDIKKLITIRCGACVAQHVEYVKIVCDHQTREWIGDNSQHWATSTCVVSLYLFVYLFIQYVFSQRRKIQQFTNLPMVTILHWVENTGTTQQNVCILQTNESAVYVILERTIECEHNWIATREERGIFLYNHLSG